MVPIEAALSFFSCYRMLIQRCQLSPEAEKTQLAEIIRRVLEARAAAPPADGGGARIPIPAGGPN